MKRQFSRDLMKRRAKWLRDGRFHILSFGVIIFTPLYLLLVPHFFPKEISTILIMGGLLTLFKQLNSDAKQFNDLKPNTPINWVKSYPVIKDATIYVESINSASSVGLNASLKGSTPDDATIEEKVDFLMRQIGSVQVSITNTNSRVNEIDTLQTERVKKVEADLKRQEAALRSIIAGHSVGDYAITLFGMIMTASGTIIQLFT